MCSQSSFLFDQLNICFSFTSFNSHTCHSLQRTSSGIWSSFKGLCLVSLCICYHMGRQTVKRDIWENRRKNRISGVSLDGIFSSFDYWVQITAQRPHITQWMRYCDVSFKPRKQFDNLQKEATYLRFVYYISTC